MVDYSEPADGKTKPDDEKLLALGKKRFKECMDGQNPNITTYEQNYRFARLDEQWDEVLKQKRISEERPCLTLNHHPAFIRQVVNDCRQNKPAITVKPVDDEADPPTADVYSGIIRNIEHQSQADVAYDTAVDCAATGGFGYFRIDIEPAHDDTFDLDLKINRVIDPLTVFPDDMSKAADSSDWNDCFIADTISKEAFEEAYPDEDMTSWDAAYGEMEGHWRNGNDIIRCEWWHRKKVKAKLLLLNNGKPIREDKYLKAKDALAATGIVPTGKSRPIESYSVCQYIMTGTKILEKKEWAGQYIPIIPVYGEELYLKGKRYFRSLIHSAVDAQRVHNYMRSMAMELTALQPRIPWVGEQGAFDVDPNWQTAHKTSHPYLEYKKGMTPPTRQPIDMGSAVGVLTEARMAVDDMKAIMGLHDASLGERSNETSGKAINARKVEGEVSTFHFPDNLARAIAHGGRVLLDLIPLVYEPNRIVRTLGLDGKATPVKVGDPAQPEGAETTEQGDAIAQVYYLGKGKYDLAVKAGPSFTTRREQAAVEMTEFVRAYPQAAPVIGDLLVESLDWPGADKIAKRLKALLPPALQNLDKDTADKLPDEVKAQIAALQQTIQEGMQKLQELERGDAVKKYEVDKRSETEGAKIQSNERMHGEDLRHTEAMANIQARRDTARDVATTRMSGQSARGIDPEADAKDMEIAQALSSQIAMAIQNIGQMFAEAMAGVAQAEQNSTQAIIAAISAPKTATMQLSDGRMMTATTGLGAMN